MVKSAQNAPSKQYVQKVGSAMLQVDTRRSKNPFVEAREKDMAVTEM